MKFIWEIDDLYPSRKVFIGDTQYLICYYPFTLTKNLLDPKSGTLLFEAAINSSRLVDFLNNKKARPNEI